VRDKQRIVVWNRGRPLVPGVWLFFRRGLATGIIDKCDMEIESSLWAGALPDGNRAKRKDRKRDFPQRQTGSRGPEHRGEPMTQRI